MSTLSLNYNISQNPLKELANNAKKLKKEIKKVSTLDDTSLLQYADHIMELRDKLNAYEQKESKKIFSTYEFKNWGICVNNLNKAQSLLLKKASFLLSNDHPSKLYQNIQDVWQVQTSGQTTDPEFGKHLLQNKKKDPVLLFAISIYLRRQKIEKFLEAVKTEKNQDTVFELYKKIDPKDLQEIYKLIGHHPTDAKEFPLPSTMIEKIEIHLLNGDFSSKETNKPHFHHVISLSLFDMLQTCQNIEFEDDFFGIVSNLLKRETNIECDLEFCKDIVKQNANHPLIMEAVYTFFLNYQLKIFQVYLERGEWENAIELYRKFPESIKNDFLKKVEQKLKQPSFLENTKNFIKSVIPNFSNHQEKVIELPQKFIENCFNYHKYPSVLKNSLNDQMGELQENIQMLKVAKNRNPLNQEKGLYYSIFTITESNNSSHDPVLNENLRLAYEALSYAIRKVPYSSNFFNRENILNAKDRLQLSNALIPSKLIFKAKDEVSEEKDRKVRKMTGILHNTFTNIIASAKTAEHFPLGNCGVLSAVVFAYLTKLKKDTNLNIEYVLIKKDGADHTIIVIGRDKNSDPKNYTTWGPYAVICDPWARKIYLAALAAHILDDYTGEVRHGLPGLKKFDPELQILKVIASNVITVNEFQKLMSIKQIENRNMLEKLLVQFHSSANIDEKKSIARMILNVATPALPEKPSDSVETLLVAQMNYFLYSSIDPGFED